MPVHAWLLHLPLLRALLGSDPKIPMEMQPSSRKGSKTGRAGGICAGLSPHHPSLALQPREPTAALMLPRIPQPLFPNTSLFHLLLRFKQQAWRSRALPLHSVT